MKRMLSILLTALIILISNDGYAQGCVAIRSTGGICTMDHAAESGKLSNGN